MTVLGAAEVRDLMERHGLEARRSLGQNFVADPNTVRKVVRLAGVDSGDRVVEVGPGLGSLTLALVEAGASVVAVEKDAALVPVLDEVLERAGARDAGDDGVPGPGRARVVPGDALALDWAALVADPPWTLVANLPYNVAVPVVMEVLEQAPAVQRLVVMVQHEVAERLVATPGGRTIGIPSIKVAWYGAARILATVGPEVFVPRPRVMSAVIGIDRRPPPSTSVGPDDVFPLVERAYGQRRKMLRSTLGRIVGADAFAAAGIEPTARPEELDVVAWTRLAEVVHAAAGSA
jgi:16S rRNA (adenine1518-N6/adenine1519-N6)-dimethyltransferase